MDIDKSSKRRSISGRILILASRASVVSHASDLYYGTKAGRLLHSIS